MRELLTHRSQTASQPSSHSAPHALSAIFLCAANWLLEMANVLASRRRATSVAHAAV